MRYLYSLILLLLLPLVILHFTWLSLRNPGYRQRWRERFGFIPVTSGEPLIWLHAASVGEVQAAAPLIERLLGRYPEYRIVITTMTPTGAFTVQQRFAGAVGHLYLPYDLSCIVRRFVRRLQPRILLVMEMELWPNLYRQCQRAGVPVMLINARMSARSAAAYLRMPGLIRTTLNDTSLIAAQSRNDAERLLKLGASSARTVVTGNLKFDIKLPHSITEQAQVLRRMLSVNRPIWIAASTHEGEEKIVLDAFDDIRERYPECLLIIAPRHPERFERVADLCRRRGFRIARRSQQQAVDTETQIYMVDTLGDLPLCYAAADIAFVGGSLVDIGGHNMLEPASLAVPILTGPNYFNFTDITTELCKHGAAWIVTDTGELARQVIILLDDANLRYQAGQNAKLIIEGNTGGIDELMVLLHKELKQG